MMLQIRMGHISSPPFWRYSITAHLLVPFGPRRKPGRGARQCDFTTSEHQSMAKLVFNRRKQRERRLLIFSEVEGRALRARRRRAPPSRLVQEQAAESFVSSLPSVWFVTSVSSVTDSARRFGRGVFPRHRKSSNRSDARRRRSEKRSCRSRSGLWPDAFPRPGDYYCRICFAG